MMWRLFIVLDLAKLALLLSLGLVMIAGLGWLLVGPLLHGTLNARKQDIPLIKEIPLALLCGMIINYGILLIIQSLIISFWVSMLIGLLGASVYGYAIIRSQRRHKLILSSIFSWSAVTIISFLILGPILTEPLKDWDARSIWFFHARMIYIAESIGRTAGWQTPGWDFVHTDYPKLLAGLAAQVAYGIKFWNEYLPKMALFFMLFPALIWLFNFASRSFSFVLLLFLIVFGFYPNIWNGYMDGILATYYSISMLLLVKYCLNDDPVDLFSCLVCLVFLTTIKNEGYLAATTGLLTVLVTLILKKPTFSIKNKLIKNKKYILACLTLLVPTFVWVFYISQWNLGNDLQLGNTGTFSRLQNRVTDGSILIILEMAWLQLQGNVLLVGTLIISFIAFGKGTIRTSLPALMAGGLYGLGILLIYLVTPMDLHWHLISSIDRTMLSVNGCIFCANFQILKRIEDSLD